MQATEPIKIGLLKGYTGFPAFSLPCKKGWQLALQEINAASGVFCRRHQVVSRDDDGKPGATPVSGEC